MNTQLILSFALLFGATIALICSVYVLLIHNRRLKEQVAKLENAEKEV